jgi:hypothetical protein
MIDSKRRLEVYKEMLEFFGKGDFQCFTPSFCSVIWLTQYCKPVNLGLYTELMKYKPKNIDDGFHWFKTDVKGIEKRKRILRKIIKDMDI